MAEEDFQNKSKFLKFQDVNGDGHIDECDDLVDVVPAKKCPGCVPNQNYVTPNWRNKGSTEPWFNEKYCKFQIAVQTSRKGLIEITVDSIFSEYVDEAIEGLITGFNKADTEEVRNTIRENLVFQKYDLNPRPHSYVKLLYSIPYDVFAPLPDMMQESDDQEEPDDSKSSDIVVEMAADHISEKLIKVRKAFHLYSRFHRVYSYVDKGKLVFVNSNKLFSISEFERYGDNGFIPTSHLAAIGFTLDGFLNSHGHEIMGLGSINLTANRVTKIEFTFSNKYRLKKLRVWTYGCGGKPYVYRKKRLKPLNNSPAWKNKTAVAYFAKLDDIDRKLSAREAPDWLDVVTEFTYPSIRRTKNWPSFGEFGFEGSEGNPTALSCMADAVGNAIQEIGQDIKDEVLGLGDAIAYQFNKNICALSLDEFQEKQLGFGMVLDPNEIDPLSGKPGTPKNLAEFATEQAFKEMKDDEQLFLYICVRALQSAGVPSRLLPAGTQKFLDELTAEGTDRLKLCGLFNLLMDAIMCLLGGLTLEEALSKIVTSALKAMSIDNLGVFFIGLPPEKQAELDALVRKKLANGDIFKDPSGPALRGGPGVTSDVIAGTLKFTPPWKRDKSGTRDSNEGDPDTLKKDRPATMAELQETSQLQRRTLAQQFDIKSNVENELSDDVIIEAYIKALVEVYADDLLEVVDMLNKFPGAVMIARVIMLLDCPRPPILKPNVLDFIKDIDIPWCTSLKDLTWPKLFNPFGWIPKLADIWRILWYVMKMLLHRLIIMIIMKLLTKLCELIGDAICKALETVGNLAAALPDLISGDTTFKEVIRDSICGGDASDEKITDTTTELFEKLGVGGAALNDKDAVMGFAGDLSSATTRKEMFSAFLGDMSSDMATAAYNLVQYDYPQFADAFSTKDSIADFFKNVGNLMPADVRQSMQDFVNDLPEDDIFPANPTLCVTPDQLEDFKELRCALLEDRATPEQCRTMFDNLQEDLLEDLEALSLAAQKGIVPEDYLPPIVSQPGCDDGLIPYESPADQLAAGANLNGELKSLKRSYTVDMLGDGGIFSYFQYGFINMILSDTLGNPLTRHDVKSYHNPLYVDFINEVSFDSIDPEDPLTSLSKMFFNPPPTKLQIGNFPDKVASWLQTELKNIGSDTTGDLLNFSSNNRWRDSIIKTKTFEELGFNGLFGGVDIERISIPDMGYNVDLVLDVPSSVNSRIAQNLVPGQAVNQMKIIRRGRKKDEDIRLEFRDNNKGLRGSEITSGTPYAYGFNLDAYYYDLAGDNDYHSNFGTSTSPVDSVRVNITKLLNPRAAFSAKVKFLMSDEVWASYVRTILNESTPIRDREFEFLAVDHTFNNFSAISYPKFAKCFHEKMPFSPPIYLLSDIIDNNEQQTTERPLFDKLKEHIDTTNNLIYKNLIMEVANNDEGFKYGAKSETLTEEDTEYVVKEDQTSSPEGTPYFEAKIIDEVDGYRGIRNSDMILGVSRDQLANGDKARVLYLDPSTYGGSYANPAVYIKPLEHTGFLGMVSVLFPEYSPCKPRNTDLIDFDAISDQIKKTYNSIPEDERLQADPNCVTEMPYNRILLRQGKASIEGMIKAACRIFASVHFIKSYATFNTIKPDFDNTFGPMFASYVVENMEKIFRGSQNALWEYFSTFKDDEFWYAFLEQSVQTYGRLVDSGTIVNPPKHVLEALFRINDAQENYEYPEITDNKNDVAIGNILQETTAPYRWPFESIGLKMYREEKKYDFVRATEEDAKIVLTEFVTTELKFIAEKFSHAMSTKGADHKITNLVHFVLSNMTQGAEALNLDKPLVEEAVGLPQTGNSHYTSGGEFSNDKGEEYTGYYHTFLDEDNNVMYMAGERHSSEEHEILTPFANIIKVPIGDVKEFNSIGAFTESSTKPFAIEKYISINGTKYNPTSATTIIKQNDENLNISDVYPGTMKLVYPLGENGEQNTEAPPVGVEGQMGVRHGLIFSTIISGQKFVLCETELDALDLKVGQFAPPAADSKLLLCLIQKMVKSQEMQYILNGVFGIKKAASMLAIYNDMAFMPSIGEETIPDGLMQASFEEKPGAKITFPEAPTNWTPDYASSNAAWASYTDRRFKSGIGTQWDEWDQEILKSSKARIKKIFKFHYNNRKFDPEYSLGDVDSAVEVLLRDARAKLTPPAGSDLLPWFRKRVQIDNPFNAKGQLCKKPD